MINTTAIEISQPLLTQQLYKIELVPNATFPWQTKFGINKEEVTHSQKISGVIEK